MFLADPFSTDSNALLTHLNSEFPESPVIGGMASGAFNQGENNLFFNNEIMTEGMVGIALTGAVNIQTVVSQGCRSVGEPFIITKAERNIV